MNSLLSSYSACSSTDTTVCTTTAASTGELLITPDGSSVIGASVADSDLVEISGSCNDLNRKQNRILVQVFEAEDETKVPIIDNSVDVGCQENISTPELAPTLSGSAVVKQTCFVVNRGIGIAESGSSISQYPQCFNGRFGFQIRVGRIVRQNAFSNDVSSDTNPIKNYLVRMKLRTTEGATTDSSWSYVSVNRYVPTPGFSVTADNINHRCIIKMDPFKFRDIRYTSWYTWTGPTSGTYSNSVSGTLYSAIQAVFPGASDGTTVESYYHDGLGADSVGSAAGIPAGTTTSAGLLPGATYTYKIKAIDYSHQQTQAPTPFYEESAYSSEVRCYMAPAVISARSISYDSSNNLNKCVFSLSGANVRTGSPYKIEWRYQTSGSDWMTSAPSTGIVLKNSNAISSDISCDNTQCTIKKVSSGNFAWNTTYYLSARSYVDSNGNGQWDSGEAFGDWWTPASTDSTDLFSCTFTQAN